MLQGGQHLCPHRCQGPEPTLPGWSRRPQAAGLPVGEEVGGHVLVDRAVLLGAVLRQEAVGVLVHAQVVQRGEVLAAEMAAVAQLLLVALDVLQERVELWERLGAAFDHTLVHLDGRRGAGEGRQETCLHCRPCPMASAWNTAAESPSLCSPAPLLLAPCFILMGGSSPASQSQWPHYPFPRLCVAWVYLEKLPQIWKYSKTMTSCPSSVRL